MKNRGQSKNNALNPNSAGITPPSNPPIILPRPSKASYVPNVPSEA